MRLAKVPSNLTFFFLAFVLSVSFGAFARAECTVGSVDLRSKSGAVRFAVEIADTFDERSQGLMFREEMQTFAGMLFVFDKASSVSFWMKNTLIPLDMLFIDARGTVRHIHENAVPGSLESIPGGEGILAVLEINGGLSSRLGLSAGAEVRHEVFKDNSPVWPCSAS